MFFIFVIVQKQKYYYSYIGFLKEPKFRDKNRRLKGPNIRDGCRNIVSSQLLER